MAKQRKWMTGVVAVGILVAGAATAQVVAYADEPIAGGASSSESCGNLTVGIDSAPIYNSATGSVEFAEVSIGGLASGCVGRTVTIQARGASGELAAAHEVVAAGQTKMVANLSKPVNVAALQSWAVTAS